MAGMRAMNGDAVRRDHRDHQDRRAHARLVPGGPGADADAGPQRQSSSVGAASRRPGAGRAGRPASPRTRAALIANAVVYEPSAMAMPASAGPTTRPRFHCAWLERHAGEQVLGRHQVGEHRRVGGEAEAGDAAGDEHDHRDRGRA